MTADDVKTLAGYALAGGVHRDALAAALAVVACPDPLPLWLRYLVAVAMERLAREVVNRAGPPPS